MLVTALGGVGVFEGDNDEGLLPAKLFSPKLHKILAASSSCAC